MSQGSSDFRNDMREAGRDAGAAVGAMADDARTELARLRAQVERLMQERVTPALAGAADTAEDYARRARETIEEQADYISSTVRERPLLAIGVAAVAGYVIGRLMGGNTYVYPDRR